MACNSSSSSPDTSRAGPGTRSRGSGVARALSDLPEPPGWAARGSSPIAARHLFAVDEPDLADAAGRPTNDPAFGKPAGVTSLHHFTLMVDGPDVQDEALIDALFKAGCDDALVGRAEGIR